MARQCDSSDLTAACHVPLMGIDPRTHPASPNACCRYLAAVDAPAIQTGKFRSDAP